jgi:2-oxoglutarate ferredoxin oxidoreductase subunit alpha
VRRAQKDGKSVAHTHLRYLNPFPANLEEILSRYDQILVPELNKGQMAFLLQGTFAIDVLSYPKLHARPFRINEILAKINEVLD